MLTSRSCGASLLGIGIVGRWRPPVEPQGASAQGGEADTTSGPNLQKPAPSFEPAPPLQLQLDSAGVVFTLIPGDEYTFEEMELRVKRAKIGLSFAANNPTRVELS